MFSLFATLFVRLCYLQVVGGEEYQAQAASQSVREIVVQPAARPDRRRHGPPAGRQPQLLGGLGRPDHARQDDRAPARAPARPAWPGSSAQQPGDDPAPAGHLRRRRQHRRHLLERLALPAGAGRHRRPRRRSRCGSSSSPRTTRPCWPSSRACAPTRSPYGINLAHLLGYLSPITEDELDEAEEDGDRSVNGASSVGRAGVEKAVRHAGCAACPATSGWPSTRWAGCSATTARSQGQPGDTLVTSIDAKVQGVVEKQLAETIKLRAPDHRHRHRPQLRRRLRRRGRARGEDRPGRRDGQPADVRPRRSGSAASPRTSWPGSTPRRPAPRCSAAPRRASSPRARRGSRS